ncbi:hypothetical protein GCM10027613_19530 [Microlunatus endophyticus]
MNLEASPDQCSVILAWSPFTVIHTEPDPPDPLSAFSVAEYEAPESAWAANGAAAVSAAAPATANGANHLRGLL